MYSTKNYNNNFASSTETDVQASFNFNKTVTVETKDNGCFQVTPPQLCRMPGLTGLCQGETEHVSLAHYEQFSEIRKEAFYVVQQCCEMECNEPESACSSGGCVERCIQQQPDDLVVHISLCAKLLGCSRIYDLCCRHVDVCFKRMDVKQIRACLNVKFDWTSTHKVKQMCDETKFCLKMRNEECHSWFKEFCCAIKAKFHRIKCCISKAFHALFCDILPRLSFCVIARLSLTCRWIRKVCLPFLFGVIVIRPCLWFHHQKDKCEKTIKKFLCWTKRHCHVHTLVVSAKLKVDFKLDIQTRKHCERSTVNATHLVLQEVCKPKSTLCPKKLCLKSTPVHPCWEPAIKANFETVTMNKAPCIKKPLVNYQYNVQEKAETSVITSLTIDSRELNSSAVHALFTKEIKTVKIVHKYTKVTTIQESCTTPQGVHCVCFDEPKPKCHKKDKCEKKKRCDSDSSSSSSSSSSDSSSSSSSDSDCKPKRTCPKPKKVCKKELPGCFDRIQKATYADFKACGCRAKLPSLEKIRFEFVERETNLSIVTTKRVVHRRQQHHGKGY